MFEVHIIDKKEKKRWTNELLNVTLNNGTWVIILLIIYLVSNLCIVCASEDNEL